MPFCIMLAYLTWPWFVDSWYSGEISTNAGGLVRWPVKLILPVGFALVAIQGISEIIKKIAVMRGLIEDPHAQGGHHAPLEIWRAVAGNASRRRST